MNDLENLIDQQALIACESPLTERARLLMRITTHCQDAKRQVFLWNLNEDLKELAIAQKGGLLPLEVREYQPNKPTNREDYFQILNFWRSKGSGVLIVEGLFPMLKDNHLDRILSEWIKSALINLKFDESARTTILLGQDAEIGDLAGIIPVWSQQLPELEEICENLRASKFFPSYTDEDWLAIATTAGGLHISQILSMLHDISQNHPYSNARQTATALDARKIQLLNRLYDIEFLPPPKVPLGGLDLMQDSFKKFRKLLTPRAKQYNLRVPKGVLLIGPPGTGKSHAAKACSQIIGIPMITVDWGGFRSFGNFAQTKLKRLLQLADRLSQVILYFDDFDKGFAGDDDLARRLAGQLLTWMQERTSDVIVIASVNRIEWLPPELTRAGRFDYLFKVDLPNNGERHSIFKLHLARFDNRFHNGGDPWTESEWRRLLKATNRCVGAEIQTIVERAGASVFCQMAATSKELPPIELTVEALLEERRQINPLAIREADRVESMRNKASLQALPSSPTDESIFATGQVEIFG